MIPSLHHRVWEKNPREINSECWRRRERMTGRSRSRKPKNHRSKPCGARESECHRKARWKPRSRGEAEMVTGVAWWAEKVRDAEMVTGDAWWADTVRAEAEMLTGETRWADRVQDDHRWCLVVWERYRRGLAAPKSEKEERNPKFLGFSKKRNR